MAGQWQQHQVFDGTYSLEDLLDWYEMMQVKVENERRHKEWLEINK
jgi:hypothetical protein